MNMLEKSHWWHLAKYATHVSLLCWIWHHLLCSAWTLVKSLKNEGRFLSEHSVTYSAVPKADFDFWQMFASLSWSVHSWNTCSWREDGETCGVTCPSLPLLLVTTEITAASLLLSSSYVKGAFQTARANGHGIFSQRTLKSRELTERFLSKAVKESRFKTLNILSCCFALGTKFANCTAGNAPKWMWSGQLNDKHTHRKLF